MGHMSVMGSSLLLVIPLAGWVSSSLAQEIQRDSVTASNLQQLVEKLGDQRFSVRERATNELVMLGISAIPALEEGCGSKDREIRFRSRRVLQIVRELDFQRRLESFAAGSDAQEKYELPCWDRFRYDVGDDREARVLFVEMQKSEPQLLRILAESPGKAANALAIRVAEIQESQRLNRQLSQLSLGTVATVLFVANATTERMNLQTSQTISAYFHQSSFVNALRGGSYRDMLRKMLGGWIERSDGWTAYQAMILSLQHNIPNGLVAAKKILTAPANPNQPYFRYYALLTVAKFGDRSHVEMLEPFLDDKTPYGTTVTVKRDVKFRPQIRDVTLAALVKLTDLDHKDFGFKRLRKDATYVFDMNTVAFESDARRTEAIQKWRDYRTRNPSQDSAPSDS